MYARLLVPLDGSHLAETVLPTVQRLAIAWDATVLLLHVIERGAPEAVHGDRHLTTVAEASPYLEGLSYRLRSQGVSVETHAHPAPESDVATSIVEHSEEGRADLIVLCTHGRGRVRDLLFGRIAQQVLRRGSAPVLLIRPAEDSGIVGLDPHRVLVALDSTIAAEATLLPAHAFACALGASLHLVMVVPTQETLRGDRSAVGTFMPAATRATLELEETQAQTYLASTAERLSKVAPSVPITTEVSRGEPSALLAARAAAADVGLIAIATHGRAGLQAIWAGSVAAQLLARTRAPLLLLRTVES